MVRPSLSGVTFKAPQTRTGTTSGTKTATWTTLWTGRKNTASHLCTVTAVTNTPASAGKGKNTHTQRWVNPTASQCLVSKGVLRQRIHPNMPSDPKPWTLKDITGVWSLWGYSMWHIRIYPFWENTFKSWLAENVMFLIHFFTVKVPYLCFLFVCLTELPLLLHWTLNSRDW